MNQVLRPLFFTILTGLKLTLNELNHGWKPRTELTNIVRDNKSYPFNSNSRSNSNISIIPQQIWIYVGSNQNWEVSVYIVRTRKRRIFCCSTYRSPMKKPAKPFSEKLEYPYIVLKRKSRKTPRKEVWRETKNCYRRYWTLGPHTLLVLQPNRSDKDESAIIVRWWGSGIIFGITILKLGDLLKKLNQWSGWVVYHFTESKIQPMFLFPGITREEPPRPKQMTLKENDSDYDPMDDKWNLEVLECYTVNSVDPVT